MSLFPATPSNGQQTTVNGIIYTYNSTQTAWIRTGTTISQGDLLVNGNLVVVGTSNLSSVSNVVILGGTNGQVLTTNGSGGLSWTTVSGGGGGASISNGTSNVNIATSGGNVTTSVAGNANIFVVTGTGANINGSFAVTGTSNLNSVSNVTILGGTNGQVLTTNGTGTLSWTTPPGSAGGSPTVWVAATTNYTMNSSDDAVVSTATGNITVTLPNASTVKSYYFQNSSSNFLMTLQTVSSQLINNSSNLVIQFNGSSCRLISDGTKFYIF